LIQERIGLVDIINELVPSKMDVDPGTVFLGMVMDTLSGRTPLYRLDEFFQDQDTELLLGKRISPVSDWACPTTLPLLHSKSGHKKTAPRLENK
jgi:hypothetical protein